MNEDTAKTIGEGLSRAGLNAASPKITQLRGDASTRRYFRLKLKPKGAAFPADTLIAMLLPPDSEKLFRLVCDTQEFFRGIKVPVPEIHASDASRGLIFMEDLGDADMENALAAAASTATREDLYRKAMDILLDIQAADCDAIRRPDFAPFCLAFDREKLLWEMNFFVENYLETYRGRKITAAKRRELDDAFAMLCAPIADAPRVLTHRDYHCRNLMIKDGRLRVIDFQDARMGPRQYDLASLLRDSYAVIEDGMRKKLLDYFMAELARREKTAVDRRAFLNLFEITALQRNIKALGTFGYMLARAGKEHFLSAVAPTVNYVRRAPDDIEQVSAVKTALCALL